MDHKAFIDANRERFLDELVQWLRIPSVSSDPNSKEAMAQAAEYLKNQPHRARGGQGGNLSYCRAPNCLC
jgi:acetylornithine deacetylase/succinyl-diaminopimelate desuccinylase-like protein